MHAVYGHTCIAVVRVCMHVRMRVRLEAYHKRQHYMLACGTSYITFPQVIEWRNFSVVIHGHEIEDNLDPLLRRLVASGRAATMRRNLKNVWRKMLHTSMYGSFFREGACIWPRISK